MKKQVFEAPAAEIVRIAEDIITESVPGGGIGLPNLPVGP